MENRKIIEEIFKIANINKPIPEPDEDGIYDFEWITIAPTQIEKKTIGGSVFRNGYKITGWENTWSYEDGPGQKETPLGETANFSQAVITAVLEGLRFQMEDKILAMEED
jgi:hypothetical protein